MLNADSLSMIPDNTVEISVALKQKMMNTQELENVIGDIIKSSMLPTIAQPIELVRSEPREHHTIEKEVLAAEPYKGLLVSLQIDADDEDDSLDAMPQVSSFTGVQLYAKQHNLPMNNLENFGINLVKFAMNNIVKNCPAAGSIAEKGFSGSESGLTVFGADGQRTEALEITDRYFRNGDHTYCHIRSFNSEGVASEVEQVVVTANQTKVHIFRLNASAAVKIAVVSADGKEGCMITVAPDQVKEVLELIK